MYNGWAFLNDRINIDFMAASFRTYFNPVIDIINFKFLEGFNGHPVAFMFITALNMGFFCFCLSLYLINCL